MAQRKKQLITEGKLDKHGRPNAETPKEYLRALPDVATAPPATPAAAPAEVRCRHILGHPLPHMSHGSAAPLSHVQ